MAATVPPLNFRLDQPDPLTAADHDENLRILRDAINGLGALLSVSVKPDGTLNDGSINRIAILADRIVSKNALHWHANFYAQATLIGGGSGGDYEVTIEPDPDEPADPCEDPGTEGRSFGHGDGATTSFVAPIRFMAANTASPVTIAINGNDAITLKKNVSDDLEVGDILENACHWLVFDGTNYQVVTRSRKIVVEDTTDAWTPVPLAGGPAATLTHNHGRPPDSFFVMMRVIEGETQNGWSHNDILDACSSLFLYSGTGWQHPALFVSMNDSAVKTSIISGGATYGVPQAGGAPGDNDLSNWEMAIRATWVY